VELVDRVGDLLREVVADHVLPRFGLLDPANVSEKQGPDDLVTIVDREVEALLTSELSCLLPRSVVVGEEATSSNQTLMGALHGEDPVWLIDPLDGTQNFVEGRKDFGVMVALVKHGETVAAWIALPMTGSLFQAQHGAGAQLNGQPVKAPGLASSPPQGSVYHKFMPADVAANIMAATKGHFTAQGRTGSAALEYTSVISGVKDFVIYHRLLPWDHAAGALILSEAGGTVEHLDGTHYSPLSHNQPTILAATTSLAANVRQWIHDA
jgi:fructose-1,6-bisphosphatase/inositol monophosphatase family enzyme